MYKEYYSLGGNPFDLTPNPDLLFMSDTHQEALAALKYGVVTRKGFLILTGDVGTGKTTLLQELVRCLEVKSHLCMLSNPALSREEFFYFMAQQFGLDYQGNKARFLLDFSSFLAGCGKKEERALLIIDEAHVLSVELLEEIRLLSNQEQTGSQVLSIFLIGQPELNQRLSDDRLLPLRQRIGISLQLQPFSNDETRDYIMFRLDKCGDISQNLFTDKAMELVYEFSRGIPRSINLICDNALLTGYSENKELIDEEILRECISELPYHQESQELPGDLAVNGNNKKTPAFRWLAAVIFLVAIAGLLMILAERWRQVLPSLGGWFGKIF